MWLARDATGDFEENKHPRDKDGKFASGGGSGGAAPKETKSKYNVAPREQQQQGTDNLASTLKTFGGFTDKVYKNKGMVSPQTFVLKNGYPYTANDKTYEGKKGKPQQCYKNALEDALAHPDRNYVEGFVSVHGVPIQHAWTVDASGQIFDSTLKDGKAVDGYYGVPFSQDYALKSTLKNKVYGLLGYESRKTIEPLLKGEVKDFKEHQDIDKLSPEVITDRLAYARRAAAMIQETDKINTPERQAMRKQITLDVYNRNIENRKRNREAVIVLGAPASGKSTIGKPYVDDGYLELDPDLAKAELPEYANGLGASKVHEESSAITRDVMAEALKNGDNLFWPRVNSPEKIVQSVKDLKALGYKVKVEMLDADLELAQKSAIQRYMDTGRFVDPSLIKATGDSPMQAYKAAIDSGLLDGHQLYRRTGNKVDKVDE